MTLRVKSVYKFFEDAIYDNNGNGDDDDNDNNDGIFQSLMPYLVVLDHLEYMN